MNSFKLLVLFILLLLGSFAQRFQRHSFDGTQDGETNGNSRIESLDSLASDGYVQNGAAVKFVADSGKVELELANKELKFQFCSDGCMGETIIVCYDCENTDETLRGDCALNQCDFRAGVLKEAAAAISQRQNLLWFTTPHFSRRFNDNNEICESIVMKSPEAEVTFQTTTPIKSRDPTKYDGKVIKLSVRGVKPGCPLYVLNAKKWTPPLATTQNSSDTTLPNPTTSKSSEANTTLWIGIGVGLFLLLIVIIGFGYCCYRTQIQKKSLFGNKKEVERRVAIPEESKKARTAENEKTADEKEVVVAKPDPPKEATVKLEPPKEPTAAKEKRAKPAKEKIPKEMKAPIVVPKPSKEITQEANPPRAAKKISIEPTDEDPTTEASVVQKSIVREKRPQPGEPPRVYVPKTVYHPEPKSVNAPKSGSLKTGKKDSLSGRHEIGMEALVESAAEQVKRHDINVNAINKDMKDKLGKFYPPGPVRSFDPREIELLCCPRISIMFKIIEALVDDAINALKERGVTFDEKSNIIEMPPKAEKYLHKKSTPEFVRSFAFGNVFREYIDSQAYVHQKLSIPLLFSIVLQRRYTVVNRRKACTWIRRELPIIEKEFTPKERSKLPYPICAIEAACKMDANGFENVFLLESLSGADDDKTQNSPHASEKLEKESAGKMEGSKKGR